MGRRQVVLVAPYDETTSAVTPVPLTTAGDSWAPDGAEWDRWDIQPSGSALVGFDRLPDTGSVPVPSGSVSSFPVRCKRLFYRLATPGSSGTMQIRTFRYKPGV
jgi:hypothetical protein